MYVSTDESQPQAKLIDSTSLLSQIRAEWPSDFRWLPDAARVSAAYTQYVLGYHGDAYLTFCEAQEI